MVKAEGNKATPQGLADLIKNIKEREEGWKEGRRGDKIIIYAPTKKDVQELHEYLSSNSQYAVFMLDGGMSGEVRSEVLSQFKGEIGPSDGDFLATPILVSTSAGGTGIDIEGTRLVFIYKYTYGQMACAQQMSRCGRGSTPGKAIIFTDTKSVGHLKHDLYEMRLKKAAARPEDWIHMSIVDYEVHIRYIEAGLKGGVCLSEIQHSFLDPKGVKCFLGSTHLLCSGCESIAGHLVRSPPSVHPYESSSSSNPFKSTDEEPEDDAVVGEGEFSMHDDFPMDVSPAGSRDEASNMKRSHTDIASSRSGSFGSSGGRRAPPSKKAASLSSSAPDPIRLATSTFSVSIPPCCGLTAWLRHDLAFDNPISA